MPEAASTRTIDLSGVRLDWGRLTKDSIGRFTYGEIGYDAAAAAMDQGFAGTGQTGNQRAAIQRLLRRRTLNRVCLCLAANEAANRMAVYDKG